MNDHEIRSRAYWLHEGEVVSGSAQEYFPFFDGRKHVISLVGGGGKSTLLAYLAQRFAACGMRTVIMTTTRMACPQHICTTIADCRACWSRGEAAACGEKTENGKFRAPQDALLSALLQEADVIIAEADGAHMLACKAPAEHEPVILPQSDIVIGVMGVEVLGYAVGEVCHRPEHVCALLGCDEAHRLTAADMAGIFVSEKGTRKHVGSRDFYAVINKCDDETRVQAACAVLAELNKRGQEAVVLTSFM
ncbi:MAG: putative selenium-dependent hydroxylase accessory protein YqeC [Clostridia bacterium]|nr:putative selenium-dependent hydroxylase accessory protein YqeC [Clostridia bacterium]